MYETRAPQTLEGQAPLGHPTPLTEADLALLARGLRAMAHPNRLRILALLAEGEMCVCDITEGLGISQPLASHHLRVLKEAGLVRDRRDAQWAYYRLDVEALRRFHAACARLFGEAWESPGRVSAPGVRTCPPRHAEPRRTRHTGRETVNRP
ncbi:MAG: ArsR/SmtB family transcription factor [Anaerolineae bacterium]